MTFKVCNHKAPRLLQFRKQVPFHGGTFCLNQASKLCDGKGNIKNMTQEQPPQCAVPESAASLKQ